MSIVVKTAVCIRIPLGTEVGLSLGDFVLDGDPAPPLKGHCPHRNFQPMSVVAKQDATWYGGRPRPRRLCVQWDPAPPTKRGRVPQFSAHVYCG